MWFSPRHFEVGATIHQCRLGLLGIGWLDAVSDMQGCTDTAQSIKVLTSVIQALLTKGRWAAGELLVVPRNGSCGLPREGATKALAPASTELRPRKNFHAAGN